MSAKASKKPVRIILAVLCLIVLSAVLVLAGAEALYFRNFQQKYGHSLLSGGRIVEVEGISLFLREIGTVPASREPAEPAGIQNIPLLLIHGFMGSSDNFAGVMDELSAAGPLNAADSAHVGRAERKVIAVDLPGYGNSDKSTAIDYSKPNLARILKQLMQQLGYSRFDLAGHSMGGEVALYLAADFPESVRSLVLIDSGGYQDNGKNHMPVFLLEKVFLSSYVQKQFLRLSLHDRSLWDEERFARAYLMNRSIPGETLFKFSADNMLSSIRDRIPELKLPTLILWGENDRVIPVDAAYRFERDIPGSTLVVLKECGHLPFIEAEPQFTEVLKTFLQNIEKTP